jgi:hypothetical protein
MPERSYREVKEAALQTVALHKLPGKMNQLNRSVRVMTLAVLLLHDTELEAAMRMLTALEAAVGETELSDEPDEEQSVSSADVSHLPVWQRPDLRPSSS